MGFDDWKTDIASKQVTQLATAVSNKVGGSAQEYLAKIPDNDKAAAIGPAVGIGLAHWAGFLAGCGLAMFIRWGREEDAEKGFAWLQVTLRRTMEAGLAKGYGAARRFASANQFMEEVKKNAH